MHKLVLVRSAESLLFDTFVGWDDVGLSDKGVKDAREVGKILKKNGFIFDSGYTSYLKRAIRTLWIVLDEMDLMWIPVTRSWRLNERHYGALQGRKKSDAVAEFGEKQVNIWRRSFDVKPPQLEKEDPRYPGHDIKYKELSPTNMPKGESLKDAMNRVLPIWQQNIIPEIRKGKNVIVVGHGNMIRALVRELDKLSDESVLKLEIPLSTPLVYELDDNLKPIKHYYLEK
jgi:2,3-bisphosphoglycerate-dependent phosphoglycerate mutase